MTALALQRLAHSALIKSESLFESGSGHAKRERVFASTLQVAPRCESNRAT
jgi:hypothetical protein